MSAPARVASWEMGLEAVVDAVLAAQKYDPPLAIRQRIGQEVADSIRAMPFAQRVVLERMLAVRPPVGGSRRRGSWLLTTRMPGFTDVGHALTGLVSFHAWTEIADADS
jgi:hypothetical protein